MSLYYCRRIAYFLTYVKISVVMDVPEDVTDVPVVTYVAYVFCDLMKSACISTLRVRIVIGKKIGVCTIVGSNIHNSQT